MADRLKQIYPAAWTITELPSAWRYAHALCIPQHILTFLNGLPKREKDGVFPFVSLHDLLSASSSSIIGFNPNPLWTMTEHPERPWLYTVSQEIELQRLKNLMTAWIQSLWGEPEADAFSATWGEGHWSWQKVDLQTAEYTLKRRLLPGIITRWLLDHNYSLTFNEQTYPLRAVAATEYAETAELMTEPKWYTPANPDKAPQLYSYVLRFSFLDTPDTVALTFAHRLMVRRWLNKRIHVKYRGKRSVYLRWSPGYLDKKRRDNVYGRVKISYIGGEKQVIWVGNQAQVFGELHQAEMSFPPAIAFREDPYAHNEIALVPAMSSDYENEVGTGVSHNDQYEAFTDLTQQFIGLAHPFEVCRRATIADIETPGKERNQSFFSKDLALPRRWATSARTIRIELHTDQVQVAENLILAALGISETSATRNGDTLCIPLAENDQTLEVVRCQDSALIMPLKEGRWRGKPPTQADNAERIRYIQKTYSKSGTPTAALIELFGYNEDKEMKHRDPKQAIRTGFIKTGRIAKFFVPRKNRETEKSSHFRIRSAVSAILRGLGCRVQPFYIPQDKTSLPDGLDILGLWMIRLNRRNGYADDKPVTLPVLVEASSDDLHLQLYLPDAKGGVKHYPSLHEALLGAWETESAFAELTDIRRFFRAALEGRVRKSHTLLILDEQNLRRLFTGLNNHRSAVVDLDGMLNEFPQIRVARLQYSHHDEAPMCLPGQHKSKYSGLYASAANPSLFYSLHDVGIQKPLRDERKEDNAGETLNSAGTVQIWMNNLQAGDDAAAWAGVIHQLRTASNHTDVATRIPQPLHDVISWLPKHLSRYEIVSDDTESEESDGEE